MAGNLDDSVSVLLGQTNHTLSLQMSQTTTNSHPLHRLLEDAKPKIAYRVHLADRVNFTKSVVIGFEHGRRNKFIGPIRSVVFWYGDAQTQLTVP